jgi:putative ABC transport system permease protein
MLRNYFKIAFRSLVKNKTFSLINIIGMAVSVAACLLLFYVVHYELSFDAFFTNKDRIYRIVNEVSRPEGKDYGEGIPAPLPAAIRQDFPQLKQVATILSIPGSQIDVLNKEKKDEIKFKEKLGVFYAEPQFFNIFDFGWLHGSPEVLNEPNTAVLTQETAERYFGNWKNAIGKSIEFRNADVLKVSGIIKNIPISSDFPLKVVISYKTLGKERSSWGSITSRRQCFVLLDEHTSAQQIESLMPAFEKKHQPADDDILEHYTLQALKDIHFDARYGNFNGRTSNKTTLWSLGMIGILLIVTASINFVNLAIAQVMKRSKEVGVRKVLGSKRWQLSLQFFGETFLILVAASCLAVGITQAALPTIATALNLPSSFNVTPAWQTLLFLTTVTLLITLISGFYPARVLGGIQPVQALKSKISMNTLGNVLSKKGLVILQFSIAQVLIIATLVVFRQMDFFKSAPLGFNKDSIIIFSVPTDSLNQTKIEAFRNNLLQEPEVKNLTFSFTAPLSGSNRRVGFRFNNSEKDAPFEVNVKYADLEYFTTYNISLLTGRLYKKSDRPQEYIVNETFLKKFGIQKAEDGIGKTISMNGTTLPIVGVLKDFHLLSLKEDIEPLVMMCNKAEYRNAGVKIQGGDLKKAIQKVENTYSSFFPDAVFEYNFFDENVAKLYADEERFSSIMKIFSGIAIFIGSLGLYGLIAFMAVQRTKEVGIRKVLGASVGSILMMFYKEFIFLVLIAILVASPIAYYFMDNWLQDFAYRINIEWWIFALSGALAVLIAILTVSFQSVKAALMNPIKSLKTE